MISMRDVIRGDVKLEDWRKYLVDPIIPRGDEGTTKPLSIAFPSAMLARLDKLAKQTNNTRSAVIKHLLRWALDAYDKLREEEKMKTNGSPPARNDAA